MIIRRWTEPHWRYIEKRRKWIRGYYRKINMKGIKKLK